MKRTIARRGTAAAAVLALSLSLAACGSEDDNNDEGTTTDPGTSDTSDAAPTEDTPSEDMSEGMGEDDGANADFSAVFGPACGDLPTDPSDPGSLDGMVTEPVATAASGNPLLGTLVDAVTAVDGLAGTLDGAPADPGLTVFAPTDDAFAALPEGLVGDLVAGAQEATGPDAMSSDLAVILAHHVLPASTAPDAIVGDQTTLINDTLTVEGDVESGITVSDGEVTANVLCGGIPTANATVYVIDQVLANPMPAGN